MDNSTNPAIATKHCGTCHKDLPRDAFYANRKAKDGLQGTCKECQKKIAALATQTRKQMEAEQRMKYPLSSFTDRQLIEEIHRRGWVGKLRKITEIDISKF